MLSIASCMRQMSWVTAGRCVAVWQVLTRCIISCTLVFFSRSQKSHQLCDKHERLCALHASSNCWTCGQTVTWRNPSAIYNRLSLSSEQRLQRAAVTLQSCRERDNWATFREYNQRIIWRADNWDASDFCNRHYLPTVERNKYKGGTVAKLRLSISWCTVDKRCYKHSVILFICHTTE